MTVPTFSSAPTPESVVADMKNWGLDSRDITGYVIDKMMRGFSAEWVLSAIRNGTDNSSAGIAAHTAYKNRFPGIQEAIDKGYLTPTDREALYIDYETTVKSAANQYGLIPQLTSKERISQYLLSGNSPSEIAKRIVKAATAANTIPAETIAFMTTNYGVTKGDLYSFYLDPNLTTEVLQQREVAANIGGEAIRRDFGITRQQAENLYAQTAGSEENAMRAIEEASSLKTLMSGVGESLTQDELIAAATGNEAARKKQQRVLGSRVAQFEGGGGFAAGRGGISGLGTAATT